MDKSLKILCVSVCLNLLQVCLAQPKEARQAEVTFIVTNNFGAPVQYRCKSFRDSKLNEEFSSNFEGLVGKHIPFGSYHYVLTRVLWRKDLVSTMSELTGEIYVDTSSVLKSLSYNGLVVFSGTHEASISFSGPHYVIDGQIKKASDDTRSLWVRLVGLYQERKLEAKVDANGGFHFEDYITGACLLLVFDEKELVAAKRLVIRVPPSKEPIQVDLARDALR